MQQKKGNKILKFFIVSYFNFLAFNKICLNSLTESKLHKQYFLD